VVGLLQRRRTLLLSLLMLLLAFALLVSGRDESDPSSFLQRALLETVSPFQKGITKGVRFVTGIIERYVMLVGVQEENQILREIIEELKRERIQLLEQQHENDRLRSLLGFRQGFEKPLMPAEVIGNDESGWFQTLVIDRGQRDGIQEGMAVITVQGAVGQIMESSRNFSRVLLITDPNSSVAAVVQNTRAPGIVEGAGQKRCALKYMLQSESIQQGDVILSSGVDGIYPKGLPIGSVSRIDRKDAQLFQNVQVEPFVDFRKLEEVFVLVGHPSETEEAAP